mgnify:CR=1 FL=1
MNFVTNKIAPTSQKLRGGYYTPVSLARYVCEWALRDGQEKVLEPSAGDGNFIAALSAAAGASGGVQVTAVEIDRQEIAKAEAGDGFREHDIQREATPDHCAGSRRRGYPRP